MFLVSHQTQRSGNSPLYGRCTTVTTPRSASNEKVGALDEPGLILDEGTLVLGLCGTSYTAGCGPMHPPGGLLAGARELPLSLILRPGISSSKLPQTKHLFPHLSNSKRPPSQLAASDATLRRRPFSIQHELLIISTGPNFLPAFLDGSSRRACGCDSNLASTFATRRPSNR